MGEDHKLDLIFLGPFPTNTASDLFWEERGVNPNQQVHQGWGIERHSQVEMAAIGGSISRRCTMRERSTVSVW